MKSGDAWYSIKLSVSSDGELSEEFPHDVACQFTGGGQA